MTSVRVRWPVPGVRPVFRHQLVLLRELHYEMARFFSWAPTAAGPYPGLRPLKEGDAALFFGRDIEIRDALRALEEMRESVLQRAFLIHAPSGAGKSSLLRAGLWPRLRTRAGFTLLGIVRAARGLVLNEEWGLVTALNDAHAKRLNLSRDEIETCIRDDLAGLLAKIADTDRGESGRRTMLLGIDQAEEITALSPAEASELDEVLGRLLRLPNDIDLRFVLTARDDSVDDTLYRLAGAGLEKEKVTTWRLGRLPNIRFGDIIAGPAKAAQRAGWPLFIDEALVDALAVAAGNSVSEIGDALPILALALQRMVARHRAPDGRIILNREDARSFIETAVEDAVAEALKSANVGRDELRRLVIPRLASWDPRSGSEGAARRQVAPAVDLFAGPRAGLRTLADALVGQRLLTRSGAKGGAAYEIAYNALLRVPPLGPLIYERRHHFEQAHVLEIEAREWNRAGRPEERLVRAGDRLSEAKRLLADDDFGPDLERQETGVADYLAACAARAPEREQTDKQAAARYYSCFISYSSKDQKFAERIHADLQSQGVCCWFAPHDLRIGQEILDGLDGAIRLHEKVLLILSAHSIKSNWVKDEVTRSFEEERTRGQIVLFPIRLDDEVIESKEAWAANLRARNIGDFRNWKDDDGYKRGLERVLRDLKRPSE
jgi:hypothetical protein